MNNYIKVVSRTENSIELELIGDDYSLCNLLKEILLEKTDKVVMAAYDIDHPVLNPKIGKYITNPKLILRTVEGVEPTEVLKDALGEVITLCNESLKSVME